LPVTSCQYDKVVVVLIGYVVAVDAADGAAEGAGVALLLSVDGLFEEQATNKLFTATMADMVVKSFILPFVIG
jgi:hypothetical protein